MTPTHVFALIAGLFVFGVILGVVRGEANGELDTAPLASVEAEDGVLRLREVRQAVQFDYVPGGLDVIITPSPTPEPSPAPTEVPYVPSDGGAGIGQGLRSGVPEADAIRLAEWTCWLPWPCEQAIAVAYCESNDPGAYNPSGATGLFQIVLPLHAGLFPLGADPFDPYINAQAAYNLWAVTGTWKHWSCKP